MVRSLIILIFSSFACCVEAKNVDSYLLPSSAADNKPALVVVKSVEMAKGPVRNSRSFEQSDRQRIWKVNDKGKEQPAASAESQRAAAEAREAASKAWRVAETARQRARQARDEAAPKARQAAESGGQRREYDKGSFYIGHMRENRRHGFGVLTNSSGDRYECEWRDDLQHGQGVWIMRHGSYEGDWSNRYFKLGVLTAIGSARYEGEFFQHTRNGLGVEFGKGEIYSGTLRLNRYEGPGVKTWPDGRRFEGFYKNGDANGYGILYLPDGTRRSGLWQDGKLIKPD